MSNSLEHTLLLETFTSAKNQNPNTLFRYFVTLSITPYQSQITSILGSFGSFQRSFFGTENSYEEAFKFYGEIKTLIFPVCMRIQDMLPIENMPDPEIHDDEYCGQRTLIKDARVEEREIFDHRDPLHPGKALHLNLLNIAEYYRVKLTNPIYHPTGEITFKTNVTKEASSPEKICLLNLQLHRERSN